MKILWLCNTLVPESGIKTAEKPESWISSIYGNITENPDIKLVYLYPRHDSVLEEKEVNDVTFISYKWEEMTSLESSQIKCFVSVLEKQKPDIIQIFGSEFPHALAMVKACEELGVSDRIVITIQGLVSAISKHYNAYLPEEIINGYSFRDFIKRDNLKKGQKNFATRGKYEEEAIKSIKHIIGRTDWDRACVKRLNPDINYYKCNETMRKPFYENEWSYEHCEKHSLFFSQWYAPLKGLHLIIEAMADLVKKYPDVHLYTTGDSFLDLPLIENIKLTKYKQYCKKLIIENGLKDHITFLGYLDENAMCERYLKSNVFVCASSIENSSNSVGEAMLLGVPTVASDVGGIKNLLVHDEEGFIYPADEPYMLAHYVSELFENQELVQKFSENSKKHARELYDAEKNMSDLFAIYNKITRR